MKVGDKITALTKERDEWKARCEFSFEQRERLTVHLDDCMNLDKHRLRSLKAIERERDAYAAAADSMAAAHKVERDDLNRLDEQRLESLKALEAERNAALAQIETMTKDPSWFALKAERDALKDAAKLALDVCIEMRRYGNQRSVAMAIGAEAALKAVL